MFEYSFSEEFLKSIEKLSKKDKTLAIEVRKKITQIISSEDITHYKNLRGPLKEFKRVHVGSFVILFKIKNSTIYFSKFEHHDKVYGN